MNHDESPMKPVLNDPFDNLEALRVSQSFADIGVKKVLAHVPVRRPGNQDFFRVRAEPEFRLETCILTTDPDRETYVVVPEIAPALPNLAKAVRLYVYITRLNVLGVWPCKLPNPDGRWNSWPHSALMAAQAATTTWVRIVANMSLSAYDIFEATGNFGEPEWPELSFNGILKIAFRDKIIQSLEHPIVRQLRGEI